MINGFFLALSALLSLVPATVLPYRRAEARSDGVFWAVLAVAAVGPAVYSLVTLGDSWKTGLSITLWVSIAVSMTLFLILAAVSGTARKLTPLLMPFLLLLALFATIWSGTPEGQGLSGLPDLWLVVHIAVSVVTYGLCTIAAVAGLAVFLQERAIKKKQPSGLTRRLPSIADAEILEVKLLTAAEIVLGLGIASGMSKLYMTQGQILTFDHKTLLAILAFVLIGGLLFLQRRTGLRGRRAARGVLVAYLLLALAYPGVKFVTDVLLA